MYRVRLSMYTLVLVLRDLAVLVGIGRATAYRQERSVATMMGSPPLFWLRSPSDPSGVAANATVYRSYLCFVVQRIYRDATRHRHRYDRLRRGRQLKWRGNNGEESHAWPSVCRFAPHPLRSSALTGIAPASTAATSTW